MFIGPPKGATCSTTIVSPGIQPISINFSSISGLSKPWILPTAPVFNSDNFISKKLFGKTILIKNIALTKSEIMPTLLPTINFHFLTPASLTNRTALKSFIINLFKKEGKRLETLNYIFCSDEYLLHYNIQYLNHNTLTDIITFSLEEPGAPIIGDIYISIDRVKENATTHQTSFKKELHRVIFHGALHLCGFKDKNKKDQSTMRFKEDYYLNKFLVPRETKN